MQSSVLRTQTRRDGVRSSDVKIRLEPNASVTKLDSALDYAKFKSADWASLALYRGVKSSLQSLKNGS